MNKLLYFSLLLASIVGCGKSTPKPKEPFVKNYVSGDYTKRNKGYDWVAVKVTKMDSSHLQISIRSRADVKRPTCTFDALAFKRKDSIYQSKVNSKNILFFFVGDSLHIAPEMESDSMSLCFYCSGGASIAGAYSLIKGSLDSSQIDPTIFTKILFLQEVGFDISTQACKGQQELTVQPFGLSIDNNPFIQMLDGRVTDAEIEDMNSDGFPELMVYTQTGKNKMGNVMAFSVNKGKSMSLIRFSSLLQNPKLKAGYNGCDEFSLVDRTLSQRFPLFKNEKKTNIIRQIDYKLEEGEAMRKLVVKRVTEYTLQ